MAATTGRLLDIRRIRADSDWRVDAESHEYHQWLIVCRGVVRVRIGDEQIEAGAGECLFYAAGCVHEEWTDARAPHESYGVCFAWDGDAERMPSVLTDAQGRLRVLAGWLAEEWVRHSEESMALRRWYFRSLLVEWRRLAADRCPPLVAKIRDHIRAHMSEPLGLDDLAAVAGLSRSHFSRVYHAQAGRPVSADMRLLRLEYAQGLLMSTDLPVKEVAARSGLNSRQYLTRLFRKHLDVTPGELRRCRP